MSIGSAVRADRNDRNMSQQDYAQCLGIDRSLLSRIESGEREYTGTYDQALSRMSWRLALEIADQRTGGFISNILTDLPNLDLHPASLKDLLLKEIDELEAALGGLVMARHIDPAKRKESAERVWHEMQDVIEKAAVLKGVLEEEFGLDRERLSKLHEQQVKNGDR